MIYFSDNAATVMSVTISPLNLTAAPVQEALVTSPACFDPSGQRHVKLAIVCLAVCFSKPLILSFNSPVSSINTHGSNFLDTDYAWI